MKPRHLPKDNEPSHGFSLLELLIVVTITSLTAVWVLPDFSRRIAQAKVDRYTRNIESGLLSLRARMGAIKGSCEIDFSERSVFIAGQFSAPERLIERQQSNGTLSSKDALRKCREGYLDDPQINNQAFRLVHLEGTQERDSVEVAVQTPTFAFTPPGTTANASAMTILIRSKHTTGLSSNKIDRIRCVLINGNGQVFAGSWEGTTEQCLSD